VWLLQLWSRLVPSRDDRFGGHGGGGQRGIGLAHPGELGVEIGDLPAQSVDDAVNLAHPVTPHRCVEAQLVDVGRCQLVLG
jgi:hypothetical protein